MSYKCYACGTFIITVELCQNADGKHFHRGGSCPSIRPPNFHKLLALEKRINELEPKLTTFKIKGRSYAASYFVMGFPLAMTGACGNWPRCIQLSTVLFSERRF